MGEILGIGLTHYPGLIAPDEDRNYPLTRTLCSDQVAEELKNPATWPEAMQAEYVFEMRWWPLDEIVARSDLRFAPRRLAFHLSTLLERGVPTEPVDVGV